MGIASLSHIGVVFAVIAVMAALWKFKQRRLRSGASFTVAASTQTASWTFLKALVLAALFAGSMLPVFRNDGFAPVIHMLCTIALTLLAGLLLFRKPAR